MSDERSPRCDARLRLGFVLQNATVVAIRHVARVPVPSLEPRSRDAVGVAHILLGVGCAAGRGRAGLCFRPRPSTPPISAGGEVP